MPPRKKTKFEQWFSFSRHQRRTGASQALRALQDIDLESLKKQIIKGDSQQYTFGSAKDLQQHLTALRAEFVGMPELARYHATLIVLLRRDIDAVENYRRLKQLLLEERDFLLGGLNARWLISACDSMIDHDDNPVLQAILMAVDSENLTVELGTTEF